METHRSKKASSSLLMWALVAALLSQNLVSTVAIFEDKKTYYSPPTDPHSGTPPSGSHHTPHHTPSHGTPPSHSGSGTTPSYGTPPSGGSHGGTPPANCGTPPSPHYDPSPAPPTGGYHYSPPTVTPTPSTPTITPSYPSPPIVISPPTTPIDPGTPSTPGITIPSPPFTIPTPPFDPNSPPFTCDYWRTHPTLIWGLFGFWGTTITGAFGVTSIPGLGGHLSLQQALSNTRTDGFGALYREGTAALLNSMVHTRFPFTTNQVRDNFITALGSNKAAAAQARVFKLANEGRLKPRN